MKAYVIVCAVILMILGAAGCKKTPDCPSGNCAITITSTP